MMKSVISINTNTTITAIQKRFMFISQSSVIAELTRGMKAGIHLLSGHLTKGGGGSKELELMWSQDEMNSLPFPAAPTGQTRIRDVT